MALTAERAGRLERSGLVAFFNRNRDLYKGLAQEAYEYAPKAIGPTGEPVRVDDVIGPLLLALRINQPLLDFLSSKKGMTQKYWVQWFGEFILDRLWEELSA